jgi:osmotically-inducible protein OsmY
MREDRGRGARDGGGQGSGGGDAGLLFAIGAASGFAVALVLASRGARETGVGERLRDGARSVADRLRPGRLRREFSDQRELTRLEDAVLDAFLRDDVLAERAIDVGAISRGIIELSGTVDTADEATRAVRMAQGVSGVETVIDRMEVESDLTRMPARGNPAQGGMMSGTEYSGGTSGMGRRRQGSDTDPDQRDDSQAIREGSLEHTDRGQFEDEDISHSQPRVSSRPSTAPENPTNFSEDELDNQSPYGKHAVPVPEQPQALNSHARVGEPPKPGIARAIEQAGLARGDGSEDPAGSGSSGA